MMMTGGRGTVRGEGGSAMIIVLMMISMLGVLTLTLATLSVNNLTGARQAQQAGVALNAADAGLAQGVEYLRGAGVKALTCAPACTAAEQRWIDPLNPTTVTIPDGTAASYQVWIEPDPDGVENVYVIHSLGMTGPLAKRRVTLHVTVTPQKLPLGIFGKSIHLGGGVDVHSQSMFTTGCVSKRSKVKFFGTWDVLNDIPASVHSSKIISDDQNKNSSLTCSPDQKDIHDGTQGGYCNSLYPNDQDIRGGPLDGTPCRGAGGAYPQTSKILDDQDLFTKYNLTSPPLTAAQLDRLKTVAISQDNYTTDASNVVSPNDQNAVMYFDLLKTGGNVNLNDITGYWWEPGLNAAHPACGLKSLVIIVDGGGVTMNSNLRLAASLYVLGAGDVKQNGNARFLGTMYANNIWLTGGADLQMDECFAENLSPALFDVVSNIYREVDRDN